MQRQPILSHFRGLSFVLSQAEEVRKAEELQRRKDEAIKEAEAMKTADFLRELEMRAAVEVRCPAILWEVLPFSGRCRAAPTSAHSAGSTA